MIDGEKVIVSLDNYDKGVRNCKEDILDAALQWFGANEVRDRTKFTSQDVQLYGAVKRLFLYRDMYDFKSPATQADERSE